MKKKLSILVALLLCFAMLAGCAAMLADGPVTLTGGEQVAKSYPDFWKDMAALGGRTEVLEP